MSGTPDVDPDPNGVWDEDSDLSRFESDCHEKVDSGFLEASDDGFDEGDLKDTLFLTYHVNTIRFILDRSNFALSDAIEVDRRLRYIAQGSHAALYDLSRESWYADEVIPLLDQLAKVSLPKALGVEQMVDNMLLEAFSDASDFRARLGHWRFLMRQREAVPDGGAPGGRTVALSP